MARVIFEIWLKKTDGVSTLTVAPERTTVKIAQADRGRYDDLGDLGDTIASVIRENMDHEFYTLRGPLVWSQSGVYTLSSGARRQHAVQVDVRGRRIVWLS